MNAENIKAIIFARPEMEYPIYQVKIDTEEYYIQRMLGMNPGDTAWYEVERYGNSDSWKIKSDGNPRGSQSEFPLGFTKAEAIDRLVIKHKELFPDSSKKDNSKGLTL